MRENGERRRENREERRERGEEMGEKGEERKEKEDGEEKITKLKNPLPLAHKRPE